MVLAPEPQLVVKHTFLEYVGDEKPLSDDRPARQRAFTEPAPPEHLSYGGAHEPTNGSDAASSSSSGAEEAPCLQPAAMALALATPEVTPLHGPAARSPWWLQGQGPDEVLLPDACSFSPAMDAYLYWGAQQCNWWASYDYANVPDACYGLPSAMAFAEPQSPADAGGSFTQGPLGAPAAAPAPSAAASDEARTTVMLRDVPEAYTRASLLKLLNAQGFFGRFNFVYLPIDFKRESNLGYALVNLVSPSEALRFTAHFQNFSDWGLPSDRVCSVNWCCPAQGLDAHVERYRNSPVMHESVPEEWRPLLLSRGVPIDFPAPTLKIKAPKVKGRQ